MDLRFAGYVKYRDLLQRLGLGPRHTGEPTRQGRVRAELNAAISLASDHEFCGLRSSRLYTAHGCTQLMGVHRSRLYMHISVASHSNYKSGKSYQLALEGDKS